MILVDLNSQFFKELEIKLHKIKLIYLSFKILSINNE